VTSFTIFGLFFLIQAVFHALGSEVFLGRKYRDSDMGKSYQRGLVFPLTFIGSGWVILGSIYYAVYEGKDATSFYIWLAVITILAFVMLAINRYKFKR